MKKKILICASMLAMFTMVFTGCDKVIPDINIPVSPDFIVKVVIPPGEQSNVDSTSTVAITANSEMQKYADKLESFTVTGVSIDMGNSGFTGGDGSNVSVQGLKYKISGPTGNELINSTAIPTTTTLKQFFDNGGSAVSFTSQNNAEFMSILKNGGNLTTNVSLDNASNLSLADYVLTLKINVKGNVIAKP